MCGMSIIVQKYGGACLSSFDKIEDIAEEVVKRKREGNNVIVVVSAMGNTTSKLYKSAYKISKTPPKRELDMLLTAGERISMAMLSIAIQKRGVESISFTGSQVGVITDNIHSNAHIIRIKGDRVWEEMKKERIVIIAGFQGVSKSREVTTLGRGGSDISAVAIAAAFGAEICEMYKDVSGIYSINPVFISKAKLLKTLSYDEAIVLAKYGADVVHYRACEIAAKFTVPIRITTSFYRNGGTLIKENINIESGRVRAIAVKDKVVLISSNDSTDMNIKAIFKLIENSSVEILHYSESRKKNRTLFNLFLSYYTEDEIRVITNEIKMKANLRMQVKKIKTISLVGTGIISNIDVINRCTEALSRLNISPLFTFTGNISITFAVKNEDILPLVKSFNKEFKLSE
ncbi:aspartate kinase [candidate division WOR-3 bacterium]|jgi:aspartate kinase|nr:aspartate kinase [candidate division WOR-3 bacterium]